MNRRRAPFRLLAAAFALLFCVACLRLAGQQPHPSPESSSLERLGLLIPMRDGVHLTADVFLPKAAGRWPTVLFRTPYGRRGRSSRSYKSFVSRGYVVVLEDVRGRGSSGGTLGSIEQEAPDGYDTINWIAGQRWSDSRVVMAGSSYLGLVQWWAAASRNPHLLAIAPLFAGDDDYTDRFYSTGGALKLGHRLSWLAENLIPPGQVRPLFTSYVGHLPLRTADLAATGLELPLWRSALSHPSYDAYWQRGSIRQLLGRIDTPALTMGGWFDNYAESDLDLFARMTAAHKAIETWIGPWAHNPSLKFPTLDFGPNAVIPFRATQAAWFARWLDREQEREPQTPHAGPPLLHLFVMGPNIWREEHEWPLARSRPTPFYLWSAGNANTSAGDGTLSRKPVPKALPDTFTYDPRDPVPTVGGPICCDPNLLPPGPLEQNAVERRSDVLVYTSAPLGEDLEVTGNVKALLFVSTSANDTDFTAKLVDVDRSGRALSICDGIQRMRYRLSLDKPVFVKRNMAYEITVDAGVTSYVFAAGHRIRLEISSSNFPRFDRNLNSSAPNADITKINKARQTVLHEKDYPSALILPLIPKHG